MKKQFKWVVVESGDKGESQGPKNFYFPTRAEAEKHARQMRHEQYRFWGSKAGFEAHDCSLSHEVFMTSFCACCQEPLCDQESCRNIYCMQCALEIEERTGVPLCDVK